MTSISLRDRFVNLLHLPSPDAPADVQAEVPIPEDGYTRTRLTYTVQNGARASAWLLIPSGLTAPAPSVLCIHQHNGEYALGKSEPVGLAGNPDVAFARDLAQRGYVTLTPDLECFEERQASGEERARWQHTGGPKDGAYERFVATRYLQQGSSLQAYYIAELRQAVTLLTNQPGVDATRLGVIGHSLGGQEVVWLLLAEPRLRAGVCSCGISTWESIFRDGWSHNQAAYVPGLLGVGDMDALVAALAPTPLHLTAGTDDAQFPIDGVRRIAQSARQAYNTKDAPDAFHFQEFAGGHGCPDAVRSNIYGWLDAQLTGVPD